MKDWPEKPYLEPKTAGRTYLEWLSTASERSRPTPQRPVGLEVLREQYRQNMANCWPKRTAQGTQLKRCRPLSHRSRGSTALLPQRGHVTPSGQRTWRK